MAEIVFFKASEEVEKYGGSAIDYIVGQKEFLTKAAHDVGMPKISRAIAGAMAEENDGYNILVDPVLDYYALSGLTASDMAAITAASLEYGWTAPLIAVVSTAIAASIKPPRTHQQWAELFNAVKGDAKPHAYEKITNPVLTDLGQANIKMATAIRLLTDPELQDKVVALELSHYQEDYQKLANDLVHDDVGLSAKIYGLMIVEADTWYRNHHAYGSDWDTLPQEIKDSLYITYTNIGKGGMEDGYGKATNNSGIPYDPLPAANVGGGLNQLFNAQEIANGINVANYGPVSFCDNLSGWVEKAKEDSDTGAAYREALLTLRAFVVEDGNYKPESLDWDNFSDQYLQDRSAMLSSLIPLRYGGIRPDSDNTFCQPDSSLSCLYEDKTTGISVRLGTSEHILISFGDATSNTLIGGNQDDHLYGMAGDDLIYGNAGNDYLEGGKGQDTLSGGAGDDLMTGGDGVDTYYIEGNDTIRDTGRNFIVYQGQLLAGAFERVGTSNTYYFLGDNSLSLTFNPSGHLVLSGTDSITFDEQTSAAGFANGDFGITLCEPVAANLVLTGTAYRDEMGLLSRDANPENWHLSITSFPSGTTYNTPFYNEPLTAIAPCLEIMGGGAGDFLFGFHRRDHITGGAGNDIIMGNLTSWDGHAVYQSGTVDGDLLEGGAGDDWITSSGGDDQVVGGEGDDIIAGLDGQDNLSGDDGNDVLAGASHDDVLSGGDGDDVLFGDGYYTGENSISLDNLAQFKVICGYAGELGAGYPISAAPVGFAIENVAPVAGNDILSGGAGRDLLSGDGGDDSLFGEVDHDFLLGGDGDDYLDGGDGNDKLVGDDGDGVELSGNDALYGGSGDDELCGNGGDDELDGGAGADSLYGGGGADALAGGAGDDLMLGDSADTPVAANGNDTLDGGTGHDTLVGAGGADTLFGDSGDDYLHGDASDTPLVAQGDDYLDGGDGNDSLAGYGGNDTLLGGAGDDGLFGEDGNDTLSGGAGADELDGGLGDDVYLYGRGFDQDWIFESAGIDRIRFSDVLPADLTVSSDQGDLFLAINGTTDSLCVAGWFAGTAAQVELMEFADGTLWDATVLAGRINATVCTSGNDLLTGSTGNDTYLLSPGGGADIVQPDPGGYDTVAVGAGYGPAGLSLNKSGPDLVVGLDDGSQLTFIGWFAASQYPVESFLFANGSRVTSARLLADSPLWSVGTEASDFLDGYSGVDEMYGEAGDDSLCGFGGDDSLSGGAGRDILYGGNGADILAGGEGDDALKGGNGNDTYLFGRGLGRDAIQEASGTDTIRFADVLLGDLTITRDQHDLFFAVNGTADSLTVAGYFDSYASWVERVEFSDGTEWNGWAELEGKISVAPGTSGNDVFYGGTGNDTYVLSPGGGADIVQPDPGGNDTVTVGVDYNPSGLRLSKSGSDMTLCLLSDGSQFSFIDWFSSTQSQIERFVFADGTELSVDALLSRNHLHFVPYEDAYGKLSIFGTLGDDQIDGGAGDETISGWLGADTLAGGDGADTYRFNLGDGADTIDNYDTTGLDTVAFGDGITLDGLKWCRSSDDLVVRVGANGDQLTVRNWFAGSAYQIDRFTFFDGTVLGNDPSLQGSAGQDLLTGTSGSDTLQGGAGNDLLSGGDGNDTYIVNLGDGVDQLMDTGGADIILFGAGITPESLTLGLGSLLIRVGVQGDALHLAGFDAESPFTSSVIETFQFADGTVLDIAGLLQGGFDIHGTAGDDLLRGTAVIDRMDGGAGADTLAGGAGSDQLAGGDGDDTLSGGEDNDSLNGGSGDDLLQGEAGHDQMDGGAGADTLEGGAGSDQMAGGDGDDTLSGGEDSDSLNGGSGNDWLQGGAGHDQLSGNQGDDTLDGGSGDDTYLFGLGDGADTIVNDDAMGGGDGVSFGAGIGQNAIDLLKTGDSLLIRVGSASDQLLFSHWFAGSNFQVDQFTFADGTTVSASDLLAQKPLYSFSQGSEGDDTLLGHDGLDIINGYGGNDTLSGAASNDRLYGGDGDDTMFGGVGNDMLAGSQGNDTLDGGLGDDIYFVGSRIGDGEDTINNDDETGFDAVCLADGIAHGDLALLKSGDNLCVRIGVYTGQHIGFHSWPNLTFNQWFAGSNYQVDQFIFADGTTMSASDLLAQKELHSFGTDGDDSLAGYEAWDAMYGYAGNDTMHGLGGADWLYGGDGDDTLLGGEGNDWLWGDTGNDTLQGGTGNDWLDGKQGSDVLDGGSGDDWLYGGDGGNTLQGGAGRDWLEGKQGNDVLDGGSDDDYYSFQLGDGADTINNDDQTGEDRVILGEGIALSDLELVKSGANLIVQVGTTGDLLTFCHWFNGSNHQVEWFSFDHGNHPMRTSDLLRLMPVYSQGTVGDDLLTGYDGSDIMQGSAGNDILFGGHGNDSLDGGDGADTYVFNLGDGADIINNNASGLDRVSFGPGIGMADLEVIRSGANLTVQVGGHGDQLTFNNWFVGSSHQIDQFYFNDGTMLSGNDLLMQTPVSSQGTEGDDVLFGYDGVDIMQGGAGNDTLLGGAGNDFLDGGDGADTYVFNLGDGADTITTHDASGLDRVAFGPGITLADLALVDPGNDLIMMVGGHDERLIFADWFAGGHYQVDHLAFADGTAASVSDLLAQMPGYSRGTAENDSLAGSDGADRIRGEAGHDNLDGYAGNDLLDGGAGDDSLQGGAGDDTLRGGDGDDTLLGGTGNDNLQGGAGHDSLSGGAGNDTLAGGEGHDTYFFNLGDGADTIINFDIHGFDRVAFGLGIGLFSDLQLVKSGVDLIMQVGANGDQLTFGNWFADSSYQVEQFSFADGLTVLFSVLLNWRPVYSHGSEGDDALSGYEGDDIMQGYAGNDTLSGDAGRDGIFGGDGDDTLQGGDGDDWLVGGIGNDRQDGGSGNDYYFFNLGDGADTIINDDDTGLDTLLFGQGIGQADLELVKADDNLIVKVNGHGDQLTFGNWFLDNNYQIDRFCFDGEGITVSASLLLQAPVYSHGTDGDDVLVGYDGYDLMLGNAGNDTLSGGAGNDLLNGGAGADTYVFNLGDGADTINNHDASGLDQVVFGPGITLADLELVNPGNDLLMKVGSHGEQLTFTEWFAGSNYQVEHLAFADGTAAKVSDLLALMPGYNRGTAGNDFLAGFDDADFIVGGAGHDTLDGYAGNDLLDGGDGDDSVQGGPGDDILQGGGGNDLLVDPTGNNCLYGGDGDDVLLGGTGDDTLQGGAGNDLLTGGLGNDRLAGGKGDDTYFFNLDDGADTISNFDSAGDDGVAFGPGIGLSDMQLVKSGADLSVQVGCNGDQLTFSNWFSGDAYQVERFAFADATMVTGGELLMQKPVYSYGTDEGGTVAGYAGVDVMYGGAGDDALQGYAGNDTLLGGAGDDYFLGGDGADILQGGDGDDSLIGDAGDDILLAGSGNDWLDGSQGNDTLDGGTGDDVYCFGLGQGADTIDNSDGLGFDEVNFSEIIVLTDIELVKSGDNLIMQVGGHGDQLTFSNWFSGSNYQMDHFYFDEDGTTLSGSDLLAQKPVSSQGTDGDDVLAGYDGFDIMQGGAGNDTLYGYGGGNQLSGGLGNDILVGGADGVNILAGGVGNDMLNGQGGNNVYIFGRGYGQDIASLGCDWTEATNNIVRFLPEVLAADVMVERAAGGSDDLVFSIEGTDDTLTIARFFDPLSGQYQRISAVEFADGVLWTAEQLAAMTNRNSPPVVVAPLADQMVTSGMEFAFTVPAGAFADADPGDSLTCTATLANGDSLPAWLKFNSATRTFSGTPSVTAAGLCNVRVAATDNSGATTSDDFVLDIARHLVDIASGNTLTGTEFRDVIEGLGGNDVINGAGGNDIIDGGIGSDSLQGGAGDDLFLQAGTDSGYDSFNGGEGVDTILGSAGDDTIRLHNFSAANTVEVIDGGAGCNVIAGTDSGNLVDLRATTLINIDHITSGAGNDTVLGSPGNDIIDGGIGSDTLQGGAGDDLFLLAGTDSGYDSFNGGEGVDTILGSAGDDTIRLHNFSAANTVELIDGGAGCNIIAGTDSGNLIDLSATTLLHIDHIESGAGNDTVFGSDGNDIIDGGIGSDTLQGGAGDDLFLLVGTDSGYDSFNGGEGLDAILGSAGDDTIRLHNFSAANTVELIDGGAGCNIIVGTDSGNLIDLRVTTLLHIDHITSGAGNDTVLGSNDNDIIDGGIGSDSLQGGAGDDLFLIAGTDSGYDTFNGGEGVDTILGSAGDDTIRLHNFSAANTVEVIDGGAGCNVIAGTDSGNLIDLSATTLIHIDHVASGAGNDTVFGSNGNDTLIGGTGSDSLQGGAGDDLFLLAGTDSGYDSFNGGEGFDTILGSTGDDTIRFHNFSAANTVEVIDGGAGYNVIAGTDSGNLIDLRATTLINIDHIASGAGNDTVFGSNGNDTLIGGIGSDSLQGGAGDDTYRFTLGDGSDSINNNDPSGVDTVAFDLNVIKTAIGLFKSGNNLEVGYSGSDKVTVSNFFAGANYAVDTVNLADGSYLSAADINQVVQDMAAYAVNQGIAMNSMADVRNNAQLMNLVAGAWHV